MTEIYLDYNASSPLRPEAASAVSRLLAGLHGNPSSIHRPGHRAKVTLDSARERVASLIGVSPAGIVFTSGGTEANNLALVGAARAAGRGHLIVSAIEHSSVLEPARSLEAEGFLVSRVPPDRDGVVHTADILREVRGDTVLVSLMHSSNEVGTLQPVAEVAHALRHRGIRVHTDAVQSGGKVPLDAAALDVDLLSLSAHKLGGPPGVGCLHVREGVTLAPLLRGGGQESNRRAGTEPAALIAGFAVAADLAASEMFAEGVRQRALRDGLEESLAGKIDGLRFHGRSGRRLPNTTCFSVEGCRGEEMVVALDLEGIAISTGSACAAGTVRPSHVLEAMGLSPEEARSTLRISLGRGTTEEELLRLTECLARIVIRIRAARRGSLAPAGAAMKGGS